MKLAVLSAFAALAASAAASAATAPPPPLGKRVSFEPTNNVGVGLRHCNYVCSADAPDGSDDFNFVLVAALNGNKAAGSVSIQSVNFDDHFLSPIRGGGKVGINTSPDADDASWMLTPGLSDPSNWTLVTQSKVGALSGFVLSVNASRTNPCGDGPDVTLQAPGDAKAASQTWIVGAPPPPPPPPPSTFTIDATVVDHVVKREFMGCHMDPGYTQDPLGWTANLVYGQAFEGSPASKVFAWNDATSAGVTATVALDPAVHVNPSVALPALSVAFTSGAGVAGWSNRGIGNEGLSIQALPYEGYVLVLAPQAVTLYVGLHNRDAKTVLDSASIAVAGAPGWQQVRCRRRRRRHAATPAPSPHASSPHASSPSALAASRAHRPLRSRASLHTPPAGALHSVPRRARGVRLDRAGQRRDGGLRPHGPESRAHLYSLRGRVRRGPGGAGQRAHRLLAARAGRVGQLRGPARVAARRRDAAADGHHDHPPGRHRLAELPLEGLDPGLAAVAAAVHGPHVGRLAHRLVGPLRVHRHVHGRAHQAHRHAGLGPEQGRRLG